MSKETKFVTLTELVDVLKGVNRPMPATFVATTEVKMVQKDRETKEPNVYYGRVIKKQKSNVFIKFDYQNSVNKARVNEGKEADFVAQPRKWGVHVPNSPLIEHKGEYYLEARFLGSEPQVDYLLDGKDEISKDKLEAFLPLEKEGSGLQDLEKEIVMRDFKVNGIREITFNGIRYIRSDI